MQEKKNILRQNTYKIVNLEHKFIIIYDLM